MISFRPAKNLAGDRKWLLSSTKRGADRFGQQDDSQKDRPEWDASQFPTHRGWAEAFGWVSREEDVCQKWPTMKWKLRGNSGLRDCREPFWDCT